MAECSRPRLFCERLEGRRVPATFLVSPAGDDANPAGPWRTAARVNAQDLEPGDVVRFEPGAFDGPLVLGPEDSGAAGNPVVVEGAGATIRGDFRAEGAEHLSVRDLVFSGGDVGLYNPSGRQLAGVAVERVEVWGAPGGWSLWAGGATHGYDGLTVRDCTLMGGAGGGILTWTDTYDPATGFAGLRITGTTVGHMGTFGMALASLQGGLVEGCHVHDCGVTFPATAGGPVGIMIYESDGTTVRGNTVLRQSAGLATWDGNGIGADDGARNCLFEGNYVQGCDGSGLYAYAHPHSLALNNVFRNNYVEDCALARPQGLLSAAGNSYGTLFEGNTVVANAGGWACVSVLWGPSATFAGNTLHAGPGIPMVWCDRGDVWFSGNTWAGDQLFFVWAGAVYESLAAWSAETGQS